MKIRIAHVSLQWSDSSKQHTHDIKAVFKQANERRYAWITGTEAGPGAGNTASELLRIGTEAGYRMFVPQIERSDAVPAGRTDSWIAVREDLVKSGYREDFQLVIPGYEQIKDKFHEPVPKATWGPKGIVSVTFKSLPQIGEVNVAVSHYLTDARNPSSQFWPWNKKLADAISNWAKKVGKGTALAFYAGDQNMNDEKNNEPQGDTFMGGDLTSIADELKQWKTTSPHGPIDVIASYDGDGRVTGVRWKVYRDKQLFLNTDHFLCEATYDVRELPTKKK